MTLHPGHTVSVNKEHQLKCWPLPFAAIAAGLKAWEFRKNDRNYKVGDTLVLREWDPKTESSTGLSFTRVVTYVLAEGFGLPDGYVIMSLGEAPIEDAT